MTSFALIFFMQIGFILLEAGGTRRRHLSGVVMKNLLNTITGAFAFWLIGFGFAFSDPDPSGFIGI